jgi:hypothetical protein
MSFKPKQNLSSHFKHSDAHNIQHIIAFLKLKFQKEIPIFYGTQMVFHKRHFSFLHVVLNI